MCGGRKREDKLRRLKSLKGMMARSLILDVFIHTTMYLGENVHAVTWPANRPFRCGTPIPDFTTPPPSQTPPINKHISYLNRGMRILATLERNEVIIVRKETTASLQL